MGHAFLIFVYLMFILFRCSFSFSVLFFHLAGFRDFKSFKAFQSDFEAFGVFWVSVLKSFLGSLFPSVQIYFQFLLVRFLVCLLDIFFQGDLFLGVSSGISVLSNFFGQRLLGFVVMGGMPGACCCLG